jgi:hypothetical protein
VAGEIAITQGATMPQAQSTRTAAAAAAPASTGAVSVANGPPLTNPSLHLDLALNLVVLQFFNAQGQVTQSIPSQKQLEAYQQDGTDASQSVSKLL